MPSPLHCLGKPTLMPQAIPRSSTGYNPSPFGQKISQQIGILIIQWRLINAKATNSLPLKQSSFFHRNFSSAKIRAWAQDNNLPNHRMIAQILPIQSSLKMSFWVRRSRFEPQPHVCFAFALHPFPNVVAEDVHQR